MEGYLTGWLPHHRRPSDTRWPTAVLLSGRVPAPFQPLAPSQEPLVRSLLLSPVFRLHLSIQTGAPRFDWAQVRQDGALPPKWRDWASRHFLLDLTQFWAYGMIENCMVTTPVAARDVAEAVFAAIPGRSLLTHLQVLVGNRTLSAAVSTPIPVLTRGPNAEAVNFMRRARFFTLNQDRFPPRVILHGVEYRIFYRDANDPDRPRPRDMVGEACRHLQNACGVLFTLRTADLPGYAISDASMTMAVPTALRWCDGPEPDPRHIRLPEGLAHLIFDARTTDAFSFAVKLATTHALDEYRHRPCPLPLPELNAIAHETEQDPEDMIPFCLELEADLVAAHALLCPVWRTHRAELADSLRELKGRTATVGVELANQAARGFSEAELHGLQDPEGWTPPRL